MSQTSTAFKFPSWGGWVVSALVASLFTWIFYDPANMKLTYFWFGTMFAISMFAFDLIPSFTVAVLLLMYYIILGVASPDIAFVGWTTPIPWLCMCGMLIGVAMEKTQLAKRIALYVISTVATSPIRLYLAFLVSGYVISAIIPDVITVDIIFMTIAASICMSLGLSPLSKASTTIILAAYFGATVSSANFLPNNTGIIGLLLVKDMGVPFTWISFFVENLPYQLLHALIAFTVLHFFGGRDLIKHIEGFRKEAGVDLIALGKMSIDEKKTLLLAVLALIAFMTEPLHGVPGYFAFCAVVLLGFTPVFNIMDGEDLKKVQFPILFFIAGCMAIGVVATTLGIPAWLAGELLPHLQKIGNLAGSTLFAYATGVIVNFLLTPVAAATSLSVPMAEIATQLELSIKPVLYSFLYGLDQFILPYELAPALIMYSTGYVRIRYIIVIMGLRMLFVGGAITLLATTVWPVMFP
ncbi:SLC13 family permease [Desulfovibrionales bacterium]